MYLQMTLKEIVMVITEGIYIMFVCIFGDDPSIYDNDKAEILV